MHTSECETRATVQGIAHDMKLTFPERDAMTSETMQLGIACNCLMPRKKTFGELRADTRRWVMGCRRHREGGVVGAVAANSFFGAGMLRLGEVPGMVDLVQVDEEGSGTVIHVDFKKRARSVTPIDLPADREDD